MFTIVAGIILFGVYLVDKSTSPKSEIEFCQEYEYFYLKNVPAKCLKYYQR